MRLSLASFCFFLITHSAASYDLTSGKQAPGSSIEERIQYIKIHSKSALEGKNAYWMQMDAVTFPLLIEFRSFGYTGKTEITLDIEKTSSTKSCLYMKISPLSQEGELQFIGSDDCPFSTQVENPGNFLLKIVDKLSSTLGLRKNHLTDVSELSCGKETEQAESLAILSIFRTGQTWYEKNQYKISSTKRTSALDWETAKKKLLLFPLQKVKENLVQEKWNHGISPNWDSEVQKYVQAHPNATLAQFLSTIWDHDCNLYLSMRKGPPSSVAELFRFFEENSLQMEKTYN